MVAKQTRRAFIMGEGVPSMPSIKELVEKGPIASGNARRSGGREGRRQLRSAPMACFPVLESKIPIYEIVPKEAIELIHLESCKMLEETGIEFRDDEAAQLWKASGADVRGYRVRIDRAQLMELVGKIPPEYTMHARNPERTVTIVGKKIDLRAHVWGTLCARFRGQAALRLEERSL